jgi:osmoprotectant transport system ATP-binding protein
MLSPVGSRPGARPKEEFHMATASWSHVEQCTTGWLMARTMPVAGEPNSAGRGGMMLGFCNGKRPDHKAAPARRLGATIEFRHVSKAYPAGAGASGRAPAAVDDLSFTVPSGEICVVVGPSGSGKTTTLKLINRLLEPTSGQILLDGQDIAALDPVLLRRRMGYVIQQIGLFPHLTIAENVATVPRLLGWPAARVRARVDELIALVGLEPGRVRDRYPTQLSGGERQRVGVARALAGEPPLMLMDEPFGAVDPIVRDRLQDEFLRLHKRLGMTVIFVTHDIDEAIKLGTRVVVLAKGGRLAQYSSPAGVLTQPASEYVARFVGADRLLKRLALIKVGELPLRLPTADPSRLPAIRPDASARDALAAILAAPEQACRVASVAGEILGVLTLADLAALVRGAVPVETP